MKGKREKRKEKARKENNVPIIVFPISNVPSIITDTLKSPIL
jgi:hypothetical protein